MPLWQDILIARRAHAGGATPWATSAFWLQVVDGALVDRSPNGHEPSGTWGVDTTNDWWTHTAGQYFDIPHSASLNINPMTMLGWVWFDATCEKGSVIQKTLSGVGRLTYQYHIRKYDYTSGWFISMELPAGLNTYRIKNAGYSLEAWVPFAVTWSAPPVVAAKPRLWSDETELTSQLVGTNQVGDITAGTGALRVGRLGGLTNYDFLGKIQVLAGFQGALSRADQLTALNSALPTGVSALTA